LDELSQLIGIFFRTRNILRAFAGLAYATVARQRLSKRRPHTPVTAAIDAQSLSSTINVCTSSLEGQVHDKS
jgi:hypothetical protein